MCDIYGIFPIISAVNILNSAWIPSLSPKPFLPKVCFAVELWAGTPVLAAPQHSMAEVGLPELPQPLAELPVLHTCHRHCSGAQCPAGSLWDLPAFH